MANIKDQGGSLNASMDSETDGCLDSDELYRTIMGEVEESLTQSGKVPYRRTRAQPHTPEATKDMNDETSNTQTKQGEPQENDAALEPTGMTEERSKGHRITATEPQSAPIFIEDNTQAVTIDNDTVNAVEILEVTRREDPNEGESKNDDEGESERVIILDEGKKTGLKCDDIYEVRKPGGGKMKYMMFKRDGNYFPPRIVDQPDKEAFAQGTMRYEKKKAFSLRRTLFRAAQSLAAMRGVGIMVKIQNASTNTSKIA